MRHVRLEDFSRGWFTAAVVTALLVVAARSARGEEAAKPAEASGAPEAVGEDVDVDKIKKKYWATGDESELGVVQNRLYSKAHKFELGLGAGVNFGDPFLSIKPYGASFGYHFGEVLGVHALHYQMAVSPSSALRTLNDETKQANTVEPRSFTGAEVTGSFLYGKLSLMGWRIIYYDMQLSGGGGVMNTENGNSPAYMAGIGQRFYLTKWLSLKFDYRMMNYKETIREKFIDKKKGDVQGTRQNFTHSLTLSLGLLFGFWN